jgi:hypothetical protein
MKNPNERTSWRHSDGKGMGQKLTARNRNEIRIRTQRSLCDRYDMRRAMVRSRDGPDGGTLISSLRTLLVGVQVGSDPK